MSLFSSASPSTRRLGVGLAAIGLLAVGGVAGGAVGQHLRPAIEMAPMHVIPIHNLAGSAGIVAIRGRVAESFGSRFVLDDGSGRTLIDGGPRADDTGRTPLGAVVVVQGRYDRDAFHPSFLVDASGTVTPLGPPPGPHHGPHGPQGPGPDDDARGPDRGPPPPPAAKPLDPPAQG